MSKRKLLLADDSVTIQKVINLTFADEGIEVITTGDGDTAIERLLEIKPDLVMVDVNMPGLNGYQICERIKQNEETKNTPVILLVGSFEPFDEEKAQSVGADAYLTKPFQSIRQLVTKVSELLSDQESIRPMGDDPFAKTWEMDPETAKLGQYDNEAGDDEMIQTSRAGYSFTEIDSAEESTEVEDDIGKTQPLSRDDIKDFSFTHNTSAEDFDSDIDDEQSQQPEEIYSEEDEVYSVSEQEESETLVSGEGDDLYEVTGDFPGSQNDSNFSVEEEYSVPEAEEYAAQLQDETRDDDMEKEDNSQNEIPQPVAASVLELDEMNLLDLPPIEEASAKTTEKTFEQTQLEISQDETEISETEEEKVKGAVAGQFSAQDFPPEVIEAIAEKVFEKLSQKLKE